MNSTPFNTVWIVSLFFLFSTSLSSQIHINEWLAKNETVLADAQGQFDDWIEIYNAGQQDIDLAGYYMTCSPSVPNQWQIPSGQPALTTVPAGGYLILWADRDIADGANHLDFKLSASGDSIALYTVVDSEFVAVDIVGFGDQLTDITMGRISDGSPEINYLSVPSPNAPNGNITLPSTYSTFVTSAISDSNDDVEETSFGGMIMDSYHLELVDDWSNQLVGLRFKDLEIPQGATIISAYIQFATNASQEEGDANLIIQCQNIDNAYSFTEADENVSSRSRTAASVNWQPDNWTALFVADEPQRTPNIASIVEEVVQRDGWEYGNNIAFIFSGEGMRQAIAFDYQAHRAAKLYINYENTVTPTPVTDLYINELAANGSDYLNETDDYSDWIEIYNGSENDQEIQGLFLSDNPANLLKWAINKPILLESGAFEIINADEDIDKELGLHANFKLGKNGETVFLSQVIDNEIILLDSITYPTLPFKATYGRVTDGADTWTLFGKTTPKETNNEGLLYLAPATIFPPSGLFIHEVEDIILTHEDPTVTLRYTLDGSIPSIFDEEYDSPFETHDNAVLRVKAFKEGYENNVIPLETYLIDTEHELPVLTISTNPDYLFDDDEGIYVVGNNGSIFGFCGDEEPSNFINDWERPANLAFFEPDGTKDFQVNAGIKIAGACSRYFDLKSMNIYLRPNQYGDDKIEYPIFPDRDRDDFKRLKLRNSGQDFKSSMLRDGMIHAITGEILDLDYQAYRPTVVYLNGEYWGVMNLRELYGGNYFDEYHDVNEDDIDLIKNPRLANEVKEGDDVAYNYLYSFIENNDLSDQDNYEFVKTKVDMDNFINYWATMVYLSCSDWPANNLMVWRKHETDGKFRWVIIDTDASTSHYGIQGSTSYNYDMLEKVNRPDAIGWPNDRKSTLFFRKLLENEEFKNEYIQRSCSIMDIVYNPERTNEFIDFGASQIDSEMEDHINRWIDDLPYLQTYQKWTTRIDRFKEFFELRPEYWVGILDNFFSLEDTYELTFNIDATTPGDVFVNTNKIPVPFNHTNTYFEGIPFKVSVEEHPGYLFLYWLETGETEKEIEFIGNGNSTLTPIFEEITLNVVVEAPQGVCIGQEVNLSVLPEDCETCTFLWENGTTQNTRTVLPLSTSTYIVTVTNEDNDLVTEASIEVEVFPLPTANINLSNISCFEANDGQVEISEATGQSPFSYQWNTGEEEASLENLSAGAYSVTFTDANNCSASQVLTIEEPTLLSSEINQQNISCVGDTNGSIELNVQGGTLPYSYAWENGNDTPSQSNLTAGTYEILVSDANNCVLELEATLVEPTALVALSTLDNVSCYGGTNGEISIELQGGMQPYQTLWNDGETTPLRENLEAGTYSVTILDANDCLLSQNLIITSPPQLASNVSTTNLLCADTPIGAINVTPTGGVTPYQFIWNNGAETEDLENLSAGEYMFTLTDANSCDLVFSTSITSPSSLDIATNLTLYTCSENANGAIGLDIQGGAFPYSILWENGATEDTLSNLLAGTYQATVTDNNDCAQTVTVLLDDTNILAIEIPTPEPICAATNSGWATAQTTGGQGVYDIIWSNENTGNSISDLSAGIYYVTATDENACTVTDSVEIIELPDFQYTAVLQNNDCFGQEIGSIEVNTTGLPAPFTYIWSNGETDSTLSNLPSGTYFLTITDTNGCSQESEYIVQSLTEIELETMIVYPENGQDGSINLEVIGGTEPYNFIWNTGQETQNIEGLSEGEYSVTITDANGCEVQEIFNLSTSNINELEGLSSFQVYPNPSNGLFMVNAEFEQNINGELQIINALGQRISFYPFSGKEIVQEVNLTNLASGVYWILLKTEKGSQTKKMLVE